MNQQNQLWTTVGNFFAHCFDAAVQQAHSTQAESPDEIALATIDVFCKSAKQKAGKNYVSLAVLKEYELLDEYSAVTDLDIDELLQDARKLQPAMYEGKDLTVWFRTALDFTFDENFQSFIANNALTRDDKIKLVVIQVLRNIAIVNYQHMEIIPFEESKPTLALYSCLDGEKVWTLDDQLDPIHGYIGYSDTYDFLGDFANTPLPSIRFEG